MRPMKLTMGAFGPYSKIQTIDFTQLSENIFLITGPTGAGKTTIFDAISYALFGEASGSSRDKDALRSDFASIEDETFVELEFELRDKIYRIKRMPQQEQKKLRGEGLTYKNADAELYLPDGSVITKVTNVDNKVNEIMGINKDQFRQIVMLPQGEFRKLLESDSVEREAIFRKIFGTQAFELIQRKLDDESKELYKAIKTYITERDTHVKHIDAGTQEVLNQLKNSENINITEVLALTKELILTDENEYERLDIEKKDIVKKQDEVKEKIVKTVEINKKLREREELKASIEALFEKKNEYINKELLLEKCRKALPILEIEKTYIRNKKAIESKTIEKDLAIQDLAKAMTELAKSEEAFANEEKKLEKRKAIENDYAYLSNMQKKVIDYEKNVEELKNRKNKFELLETTLNIAVKNLKENKNEINLLEDELKKLQELETKVILEEQKIADLKTQRNELLEAHGSLKSILELMKEFSKNQIEFEAFDLEYKKIKASFEKAEDIFKRGQAGLLARGLEDGCPCPVCGSLNHPTPAKLIDKIGSQEELDSLKLNYEKITEEKNTKLNVLAGENGRLNTASTELNSRLKRLSDKLGEVIPEDFTEAMTYVLEKGKTIKSQLVIKEEGIAEYRKKLSEKPKIEDKLNKLKDNIITLEEDIAKGNQQKVELFGIVAKLKEGVENFEQDIPEDIRTGSKLFAKLNELKKAIEQMELSYKDAMKSREDSRNALTKAQSDKDSKEVALTEAVNENDRLFKTFEEKIKEAGFISLEEFKSISKDENEINALQKDIEGYNQSLETKKVMLDKISIETKDLSVKDIDEFNNALIKLEEQFSIVSGALTNLYARIKNNKNTIEQIEGINSKIVFKEEKYKVVGELARVAKGDNSQRITFERYVLAAYFDEIITAANIRLDKMTNGRFKLSRKEEKGKGSKQQGLELEVFDNYTGKARHVKTLSGGESFKASLALALGLADVVQSYAGGISLDTMFVDEGFGTLDPESLDNAVSCLVDLQNSGRLVGIISHVPELKERISSRLEIYSTKEGSIARFAI